MRKLERKIYETADQLERRLQEQEALVASLSGAEKRAAMIELSKLRNYAEAKRWMERK
jgi:hypothetical protein